jgi:hypothetical protein
MRGLLYPGTIASKPAITSPLTLKCTASGTRGVNASH